MIVDIKVPTFAESISEGALLDWNHQPGDAIAADETLIEIETDKVVLEVPSPCAGILKEIVREGGATVTSEEVIARIDTEGVAAAPEPEKPSESPAAGSDEE